MDDLTQSSMFKIPNPLHHQTPLKLYLLYTSTKQSHIEWSSFEQTRVNIGVCLSYTSTKSKTEEDMLTSVYTAGRGGEGGKILPAAGTSNWLLTPSQPHRSYQGEYQQQDKPTSITSFYGHSWLGYPQNPCPFIKMHAYESHNIYTSTIHCTHEKFCIQKKSARVFVFVRTEVHQRLKPSQRNECMGKIMTFQVCDTKQQQQQQKNSPKYFEQNQR